MGERLKRDVLLHETGCGVLVSWIIEIAKRERGKERCVTSRCGAKVPTMIAMELWHQRDVYGCKSVMRS